MTPTAAEDAAILNFNPWGDDDTPVVTFSDRMVITRVTSECAICFGPIVPGDRVRTQVQRCDDYGVRTFRFCVECCAAMLRRMNAETEDDEMEIEGRYDLGRTRAEAQRG